MGIKLIQNVMHLPSKKVTNFDLEKIVDTTDEWIVQRTGIKNRYFMENIPLKNFVFSCVDKFDPKNLEGIDVILVTSMSNKNLAPTLSTAVANYLNIENVLCLDLNAACSGYVYGLINANCLIQSGIYNKVLLISAEKMSNILDKTDRKTVILFGDGVGASIIQKSDDCKIISQYTKTLKTDKELFTNNQGYLEMLGQDVFKFAYKAILDCINYTLEDQNINIDDIDYFIFHQANIRIINKVKKKLNIEEQKILINIQEVANISSASIPIILAENNIPCDKLLFMCGFGAGLSYGSVLYKN